MQAEPEIIYLSLGMMLSIAMFNCFGIFITKVASSAQRATIDTSRTLIIWIVSCLLGNETFHWQAIFGFILLVLGTLVYNEILVIPFFGLDQNTKEKLQAKQTVAYQNLSPGAAYDSNRNSRLLAKVSDSEFDKVKSDDHDFDMNHTDELPAGSNKSN